MDVISSGRRASHGATGSELKADVGADEVSSSAKGTLAVPGVLGGDLLLCRANNPSIVACTLDPAARSRVNAARTSSLGRWDRSSHTLSTSIDIHSGSITTSEGECRAADRGWGCREGLTSFELSWISNRHSLALPCFFPISVWELGARSKRLLGRVGRLK